MPFAARALQSEALRRERVAMMPHLAEAPLVVAPENCLDVAPATGFQGAATPRTTVDGPLFILFNERSGSRDAHEARERMSEVLGSARRAHQFMPVSHPRDLPRLAGTAVELAMRYQGAVVAAGGDGTINAVAQAAVPADCPFGIVPQGTFNYTPRANGVPLDTTEAAEALLHSRIRETQVGLVNDRVFLVNASLGLYPELLEEREKFKRRYGRYRATAVVSGLVTLLREHRQLELEIDHDGKREWVRTPTVFVGNNALQLEAAGLDEAKDIARHKLVGVIPRPVSTAALFGLALRGALGTLGEAEQLRHFPFRRMTVRAAGFRARRAMKVATDGELRSLSFPIEFAVSPKPLLLLVPDDAGQAP